MRPQLLLFPFMTIICAAVSSSKSFIFSQPNGDFANQHQLRTAVSHTPQHSDTARPSFERTTYTHGSTSTIIHTSCSAEHSCVHTTHPATAVQGPEWYTTTLEGSAREVKAKRPATAATSSTRHSTVSEDIDTGEMLLPVHRIAESPGVGALADTTISANRAAEPIETAGMLLPVHRVAESPGVGVLAESAPHSTISASGAVGSLKKGAFLLPVHRVAESPGVVGFEASMSAGKE